MTNKDEIVKVTEDSVIVDVDPEVVEGPPPGMQKMYLSGPMTNIKDFNHPLFLRVATEFRLAGFEVCSPAEFFDGDTTRERKEYMREAFKYLLEADTIVLLPGWQDSEGARIEVAVAKELELIIVEYIETPEQAEQSHKYIASLTPVDEDGNPIQNLGSFTPVEETAPDNT